MTRLGLADTVHLTVAGEPSGADEGGPPGGPGRQRADAPGSSCSSRGATLLCSRRPSLPRRVAAEDTAVKETTVAEAPARGSAASWATDTDGWAPPGRHAVPPSGDRHRQSAIKKAVIEEAVIEEAAFEGGRGSAYHCAEERRTGPHGPATLQQGALIEPRRRRSSTCSTPRLLVEELITRRARRTPRRPRRLSRGPSPRSLTSPPRSAGHRRTPPSISKPSPGTQCCRPFTGHPEPLEAADRVRSAVGAIPVAAELPFARQAPLDAGPALALTSGRALPPSRGH